MPELNIGGQAVIEGVMFKSKNFLTISTINKDKITTKKEKKNSLTNKKLFNLPLIRGIIIFIETLIIGIKTLNYSANQTLEEENKNEKISTFQILLTILLAFGLAILIFKFIPLTITQFTANKINIQTNTVSFNLIEGLLKVIMLILYILIISRMKDVKRVFQYHGAEHKAVNCYENNLPLEMENVKKFSTLHPRCGTSFILFALILSIIAYSFIPKDVNFLYNLLYRILLLPLIIAIAYELIKLSSKKYKIPFLRILIIPGLLLQKLTTKEPDEKQLKVSITALQELLKLETLKA